MWSNSVYLDRTATALHCIFVAILETASALQCSAVQCSTNCKLQISTVRTDVARPKTELYTAAQPARTRTMTSYRRVVGTWEV